MSIRYATLDVGATAQSRLFLPGLHPGYRVGWYQFFYGHNAGRIVPISFAQSILIPEHQGATGGKLWLPAGTTGSLKQANDPDGGFSIHTPTGIINYALRELTGANQPSGGNNGDLTQGAGTAIEVPTSDAGGNMHTDSVHGTNYPQPNTNKRCPWALYAACIAFATDIAQQAAMYNAAETYVTMGPSTGSFLWAPTSGVPRSVALTIGGTRNDADTNFGSTGLRMLGHYAWYYDGYLGPIKYLNNTSLWTIPEMPTATGLYVVLKNGFTATGEMGVNEFMNTALQATLGAISLTANETAGLAPQ